MKIFQSVYNKTVPPLSLIVVSSSFQLLNPLNTMCPDSYIGVGHGVLFTITKLLSMAIRLLQPTIVSALKCTPRSQMTGVTHITCF